MRSYSSSIVNYQLSIAWLVVGLYEAADNVTSVPVTTATPTTSLAPTTVSPTPTTSTWTSPVPTTTKPQANNQQSSSTIALKRYYVNDGWQCVGVKNNSVYTIGWNLTTSPECASNGYDCLQRHSESDCKGSLVSFDAVPFDCNTLQLLTNNTIGFFFYQEYCSKPASDKSWGSTQTIILVVCLVAAAGIAGFVFILYKKRRQKWASTRTPTEDLNDPSDRYGRRSGKQSYRRPDPTTDYHPPPESHDNAFDAQLNLGDLSNYRLDATKLREIRTIATGAHGIVSLGDYNGDPVAIKKILHPDRSRDAVESFIDEIKLMARMESPYIVKFIGVTWNRPRDITLVLEYMAYGDLRDHLNNTDAEPALLFPWNQKIHCCLDIVNGLLYLHSHQIIHRDLKSRNVLMTKDARGKLIDFGVSREAIEATMTQGIGTYRWTAPEVLRGKRYTVAADMYSFGIVLSEFATHQVPFWDAHLRMSLGTQSTEPLSDFALLDRLRDGTIRPSYGSSAPEWLVDLADQCLSYAPEERPTAMHVATILSQIYFYIKFMLTLQSSHFQINFGMGNSPSNYLSVSDLEWLNSISRRALATRSNTFLDDNALRQYFVSNLEAKSLSSLDVMTCVFIAYRFSNAMTLMDGIDANDIEAYGRVFDNLFDKIQSNATFTKSCARLAYINRVLCIIDRDEATTPRLLMESADAMPLSQYLIESSTFKEYLCWGEKLRIARDIATGLQYLHENGVIHKMLNTNTVLLSQNLSVKLSCFGMEGIDPTATSRSWCTVAPEVRLKRLFSRAGDVFSFASVAHRELMKDLLKQDAVIVSDDIKNVYEGTYGEFEVLVKRPNDTPKYKNITPLHYLKNEVVISSRVQSQNIINQYGIIESNSTSPAVIIEKMTLSLHAFIARIEDKGSFNESNKLHIAICIAQALANLHEIDYVHCNVHSSNVFMNTNRQVKLGNLILTQPEGLLLNEVLFENIHHLAPEVKASNPFKNSADVYAFGKLFISLELCEQDINDKSVEISSWCYDLLTKCCNTIKKDRPAMEQVVRILNSYTSRSTPNFLSVKMKGEVDIPDRLAGVSSIDIAAIIAIKITLQIAEAVADVHKFDVLHLNVKSANYLVTTVNGVLCIKIGYFGQCRMLEDWGQENRTNTCAEFGQVGAPGWKAPELLGNKATVEQINKVDVYALGVVFSVLDSLKLPIHEKNETQIYKRSVMEERNTPQLSVDCPHEFKSIVEYA
ncbi:kinase [Thraustotheca clavata]|uniref:Kinase n=1 Tax=Thraustotheca clavata TaxID=74557 RepID=A0A1V9YRZ6_9STRA|nr:kinase [Thraustotheca clavata]